MKLVYIISDIDKAVYFEKTALALREEGFDLCFILINSEGGQLDHFLQQAGFDVHHIHVNRIINSFGAIHRCRKILKRNRAQLVHCHLAMANWVGLWSAWFARVPDRIFTRHAGAPLHLNKKEYRIDRIQNWLATRIVAITEVVESFLLKQGVSQDKLVCIHHGFDLDQFEKVGESEKAEIRSSYNPDGAYPAIGVISRWMEWKGVQYTIEAFRELLTTYPDARLYLFGGGKGADFEGEIQRLIAKVPKNNYRIVPFENNVFALYSLFDVYVHVPVNEQCEAFGQTYVEALAAGCPSVFTLSGIAREFIVHKQHAWVVPFRDQRAVLTGIKHLLTDESLKKQLVSQGRVAVRKQFGFSSYIMALTHLYKKSPLP